jgi:outer membrane protein assembly factor BamB
VGCHLFQIRKGGSGFTAAQVYANKAMVNHHGGVVKRGDYGYGHSEAAGWTCQEFTTGKVVWQEKGVGKGAVTYADGHLYCRSEDGPVALVEATPEGYKEKGRLIQPGRSAKKAWPHPVVAGGRLFLRDQNLLLCYDIGGRGPE